MNTLPCPTSNSGWNLLYSSSYSNNNYAYAFPSYDNKIFILKFNQTSGATIGTQYISDESWTRSFAIKEHNNNLYLLHMWSSGNGIVIQNMTDSSFSYYKTVAGTELLHDIIFKSQDKI